MILYICVTVITVILAYIYAHVDEYVTPCDTGVFLRTRGASLSRAVYFQRLCLLSIFVILFAVSACRINVGNDYGTYVEFMHRLYTDKYIADAGVPTEWGFNLLARIIYALSGGENFLLVFAIYAFVTVAMFSPST